MLEPFRKKRSKLNQNFKSVILRVIFYTLFTVKYYDISWHILSSQFNVRNTSAISLKYVIDFRSPFAHELCENKNFATFSPTSPHSN